MNKSQMLRNLNLIIFCVVLSVSVSCNEAVDCGDRPNIDVDTEQLESEIEEIEAYLESEGIDYETDPSGIRYSVNEQGSGEGPNFCATVFVDYTGKELGSDDFFSSGIETQFSLRNNSVVPGFKLAVSLMNRNAEYRVYVPASLLNVKGVSQTQPGNLPIGENVEFRIRLTRY